MQHATALVAAALTTLPRQIFITMLQQLAQPTCLQ
jgi:hypothetical protein